MNTRLTNPTANSSRWITIVAIAMKVTISPIEARPCRCSQVPSMMMARMASVVAARVSTVSAAHQDSTGICGAEQLVDHVLERRDLRLDAGEALHQGDVAERVGGALGHLRVVLLDRLLHAFGPCEHQRHQHREHDAQHDQEEREPPVEEQRQRQQDDEGDETDEMIAEEGEPQGPQRVGAG